MSDKFEKVSDYFYEDTFVLKNLLDIRNEEILNEAERKLTSLRLAKLTNEPIKGWFKFEDLREIHRYLFQDVYGWAGEIRKCEINKSSLFCLFNYIETEAKEIFDNLFQERYYINYDTPTTINKLVSLFADINALHAFREGNGRTQRIYIENLARVNGIKLDLTKISQQYMITASQKAMTGDESLLQEWFIKCSLPSKYKDIDINDSQIFDVIQRPYEEQVKDIIKYCDPRLAKALIGELSKQSINTQKK